MINIQKLALAVVGKVGESLVAAGRSTRGHQKFEFEGNWVNLSREQLLAVGITIPEGTTAAVAVTLILKDKK